MQVAVTINLNAQTALGRLKDPIGLPPMAVRLAAGGLEPKTAGVMRDLMLDAIARDITNAAIPVFGALVLLGALTEEIAGPRWASGDVAVGELIAAMSSTPLA